LIKLAKLPVKQIWRQIVQYANADLHTDDKAPAAALQRFKALVAACMNWTGLIGGESVDFDIIAAGSKHGESFVVIIGGDEFELCRDVREGLSPEAGGKKYQEELRQVLAWIVEPRRDPKSAGKALAFLWLHGRENIAIKAERNEDFSNDMPFFYFQSPTEYGSIVSPICKFILDSIDHFQEAPAGLSKTIPLGLCERPGCGRFMVVERKGRKRFCSDTCRVQSNQGSPKVWAARMRSYRKKHSKVLKEMAGRPIRIAKPKGGKT